MRKCCEEGFGTFGTALVRGNGEGGRKYTSQLGTFKRHGVTHLEPV